MRSAADYGDSAFNQLRLHGWDVKFVPCHRNSQRDREPRRPGCPQQVMAVAR
jgi:hypothetical protein